MTMMGTPGASRPHVAAQQPLKRCGLFRINPGSAHMINLPGGEQQCTAGDHRDYPGAKTVFFCLNKQCSGQQWPDHVSMLRAHPTREQMEKNAEAHPYAMWSDDTADIEGKKAAELAAKKSQDELDALIKQREKIYIPKEEIDRHIAARDRAQEKVASMRACIGLIAPPDPRVEE